MDKVKLKIISDDVLSVPFESKPKSAEFCGVYVDGTSNLTFDEIDPVFHSFRRFSQYEYPNYLFVSLYNNKDEIKRILKKYPYTYVYEIPPLYNPVEYNFWMINSCFRILPDSVDAMITHQSDGFLIKDGWEEYVKDFDYLGAIWKEPVKLKESIFNFPALTIGNGGFSFRRRSKLLDVLKLVERNGGQEIIKGICIDGDLKHNHMYVNEDIFFTYFGFGGGIFRETSEEQANNFSVEPIKLVDYWKRENFGFHKIDE